MTIKQVRLIGCVVITLLASVLWLWSYVAYPGGGFVRTLVLFAIIFLAARPFENEFRLVSQEQPINPELAKGVFLGWLLVLLSAILLALSTGHKIPVDHGPNRPIGFLLFIAPMLFLLGLRVVHIYRRLGRIGA